MQIELFLNSIHSY